MMRKIANTVRPIPSPRGTAVQSGILDLVNLASSDAVGLGELVTILSTGRVEGREAGLARLYCEANPKTILSFFGARGVDRMRLVEAYERAKAVTGCRSFAFERSLAGQFVFTS